MERRRSGIAVSVREDIFGCFNCCTDLQLKALPHCAVSAAFCGASMSCRTNCFGRRKTLPVSRTVASCLTFCQTSLLSELLPHQLYQKLFTYLKLLYNFPLQLIPEHSLEYLILSRLQQKPSIQTRMLMWLPATRRFLGLFICRKSQEIVLHLKTGQPELIILFLILVV